MNRRLYHTFLNFRTGLIVLLGLMSIYGTQAQGLVPDQTEFEALKDLYEQLGGANWNDNTNWPSQGSWPSTATAAQMGTWYGLREENGDIVQIYLQGNNMAGIIPASLSNLKGLVQLEISNSYQITGTIPPELGDLPHLESFYIWGTSIEGKIPCTLGKLTTLTRFGLMQNQLKGEIPSSIGSLVNLLELQLNGNQLSGELPSTLSNLTQLITIGLFNNQLSGSLSVLTTLPSLRNIYLWANHFSGSLPEFKANGQLTNIMLDYNQLSGSIPSSIENLTSLQLLTLSNNYLSKSIQGSINNISSLYYVDLRNNDFTSLEPGAYTFGTRANMNLFVEGNHLDFSVLETLKQSMSVASYIGLLPQQEGIEPGQVGFKTGEILTIGISANRGQYSTVNWEKQSGTDWVDVTASNEDANGLSYKRNIGAQNDVGTYRWKMTNSQVTGDAIYSTPMRIDTEMQLTLDNYAFQYKYDGRKRMTHKKVPGADWVYMVYDDRDRLVLTQDGNQRANKEWTFTKYDALNRPVMTGVYTHESATDQAGMQEVVNTFYTNLSTSIENPAAWYETFSLADGNQQGYDNRSFPRANTNPLTISYYDNYEFLTRIGPHYEYDTDGLSQTVTAQNQTYTQPTNEEINRGVIGQTTGSSVKDLGTGTWLNTVTYYDDKYRAVQVISDNAQGGSDKTSNLYDFVGKILQTKTTHHKGTLKWKNVYWSEVTPNQIIKTGNDNMGWAAGATSEQGIAADADGSIEWMATKLSSQLMLGLSVSSAVGNYGYINYGMMQLAHELRVYEYGNPDVPFAASVAAFANFVNEGDVLKIARENGSINYYHNNVLIYTSSHPTTNALYADASILDQGGTIRNIRTSFAPEEVSYTLRTFTYDHAGRLLTTHHSIDGATPILLSKNEYNELGQLVDKKLHSTQENGSDAKQSIDYRYNIRGWLTSINAADLSSTANTSINDDSDITKKDLFGMELAYEQPVTGLTTTDDVQYNGNISAISYSNHLSLGTIKSNGYKYAYDPMNRLLSSNFRQKQNNSWGLTEYLNGTTPLSKEANSETGFEYDLNGNIKKLNRSGAATTSSTLMDQLDYTYEGNQLLHVDDDGDKTKGFIDGNVTGDDYSYDANGNMTVDKNKGITAITYNHLNLPDKVTKNTGEYIKYSYDATGRKLSQQVYDASNTLKKKSDYAGEYFYENDTLKFINHEEGRVIVLDVKREDNKEVLYRNDGTTLEGLTGDAATPELVTLNGASYVKLTNMCPGECYGAGMKLINISTQAGETYLIRMKGYGEAGAVVPQIMLRGNGTSQYLSFDNWLAVGASSERWTEVVYTIQEGTTDMDVYLTWWLPSEGQIVYVKEIEYSRLKSTQTSEYQYHLKDHLGNVRTTFTTKEEIEETTATLETAHTATERSQYVNYDDARVINSYLFDHTNNASDPVDAEEGTGSGDGNAIAYGGYAVRLSGIDKERIGLARSLSVMPGDKIDIEVWAKYFDPNASSNTPNLTALMNGVEGNGTGLNTGTVIDGAGYQLAAGTLLPFVNALTKPSATDAIPKAYLNWAVFDRDYKQDLNRSGYKRITINGREDGTNKAHEQIKPDNTLEIAEPGYVYIWLSNEAQTTQEQMEVYFDDFKVTHTKSPVVQQDEYYPFGLTFNSYNRENAVDQKYLFNGKELQDELSIGWLDFGARMYQPEIGRWGVIDPVAELTYLSPFNYTENNPINLIDPTGMFSTHTDSTGNVLAVYNDGDLGVYRHDDAKSKEDVDKKREESSSTDGGGEEMGETEHWDEFVNISTGKAEGTILFDTSWEPLIEWGNDHANSQDLSVTMNESKRGQVLDIKTNSDWAPKSTGGVMTGRLLNGKYATARSAGNYLAGINGVTGTFQGQHISGETYMKLAGAYQQGKLSKANIIKIITYGESYGSAPYYGEENYSGRRIQEGINAGYKKLKK